MGWKNKADENNLCLKRLWKVLSFKMLKTSQKTNNFYLNEPDLGLNTFKDTLREVHKKCLVSESIILHYQNGGFIFSHVTYTFVFQMVSVWRTMQFYWEDIFHLSGNSHSTSIINMIVEHLNFQKYLAMFIYEDLP